MADLLKKLFKDHQATWPDRFASKSDGDGALVEPRVNCNGGEHGFVIWAANFETTATSAKHVTKGKVRADHPRIVHKVATAINDGVEINGRISNAPHCGHMVVNQLLGGEILNHDQILWLLFVLF